MKQTAQNRDLKNVVLKACLFMFVFSSVNGNFLLSARAARQAATGADDLVIPSRKVFVTTVPLAAQQPVIVLARPGIFEITIKKDYVGCELSSIKAAIAQNAAMLIQKTYNNFSAVYSENINQSALSECDFKVAGMTKASGLKVSRLETSAVLIVDRGEKLIAIIYQSGDSVAKNYAIIAVHIKAHFKTAAGYFKNQPYQDAALANSATAIAAAPNLFEVLRC